MKKRLAVLSFLLALISVNVFAQSDHGVISYASFEGSANSLGEIYDLEASLGYRFNNHWAIEAGLPVYFIANAPRTTQGSDTNGAGLGNLFADVQLRIDNPTVNYKSVLTGYAPTGDTSKGLSTGRATFDWSNKFDRSFEKLTPFFIVGVGNTIPDTEFFKRPFTTLGFNTHFEGGATYNLAKHVDIGASGWDIAPGGQQKVFSRLVGRGANGNPAAAAHGRVFNFANETVGGASIAADQGISTWADFFPGNYLDFDLGYTRSFAFDLNTVSFGVEVNIGKLTHLRH
jgi:hypothetical protein